MPQDQDDIKGTDAMKQAPTPGPLSGDDVNRECKACGAFKAERDAACTFCGLAPTAPVEALGETAGPDGWQTEPIPLGQWVEIDLDTPVQSSRVSGLPARWRSIVTPATQPVPAPVEASVSELHPATVDLVERFAAELKSKLAKAEAKYGYRDEWLKADWQDELTESLAEHIQKGDPRDVAAYCAFAWHHGWSTSDVAGHIAPKFHFQASRERIAKCIRRAVGDAWIGECQAEVAADAVLNLRPQPSGETRDEVARIVDPAAFLFKADELMKGDTSQYDAFNKADRILALIRSAPVASGGQHSSAPDFPPGEVTDEWAERFCEAVNWSPDGQECKAVEGQARCVSFRDLAKGYILSAIATQPAITSVTAPDAETAGEAHEARAIRLQAALDAAIAADDGLARAAAAEAQLDRLVDYLAGHLNGLRVGRKEAVDTVIVNLTKLIEAQATTPPVPAQDDDKLREEETEVQYEVWGAGPQGDFCAGADTLSDAQHYAVVYGQDGPVVIKVATTTRVVWAEASPALKSTAAQEGGE